MASAGGALASLPDFLLRVTSLSDSAGRSHSHAWANADCSLDGKLPPPREPPRSERSAPNQLLPHQLELCLVRHMHVQGMCKVCARYVQGVRASGRCMCTHVWHVRGTHRHVRGMCTEDLPRIYCRLETRLTRLPRRRASSRERRRAEECELCREPETSKETPGGKQRAELGIRASGRVGRQIGRWDGWVGE